MSVYKPWEFEHIRQRRVSSYISLRDEVMSDSQPCPFSSMCVNDSDHEFAKIHNGAYVWCERCNELRGPFPTYELCFDDYERVQLGKEKPVKTKEVRDVFCEMLLSLSFSSDHVDELALIYDRHDLVKCRTRSLCAAILFQWMNSKIYIHRRVF